MQGNSKGQAFGLLFFTFFIWGSIYVAGKFISDDLPPALIACLRCCIALLPLLYMSRHHWDVKIDRTDWIYFIMVGVLGYFLSVFLIQLGISLTGAATASLINALTPVSVTILAALLLKEAITHIKVICLILALAGATVITWGSENRGQMLGIIAVLGAVVSWGFASVFMRKLTVKYPPILVTTYGMAASLICHIPIGLWSATTHEVHFSLRVVFVILFLGFLGSGFSQYTWTKSLSLLPASTCSLFYPLQPVFSAVLGAWLLGEQFTYSFFLGLILISLDVALSTWETKKSAILKKTV